MVERAVKCIQDSIRVQAAAELSASHSATDDPARNIPPGLKPSLAQGGLETDVELGASDQWSQETPMITAECPSNQQH